MKSGFPEDNFGNMFQKWHVGFAGTNYLKINFAEGDLDHEFLQFTIQNEGDETEFVLHHLYVRELVDTLNFYLDLIERLKKGKLNENKR